MLHTSVVDQDKTRGFTIVELLIVVVVIAILAAITIVSYNGIQNRTHDTAVQSDLRNYAQKVNLYFSEFNTLPVASAAGLGSLGAKATKSSYGNPYVTAGNNYNLLYCKNDTDKTSAFIAGSKSGKLYIYKNGSITEGAWLAGSVETCAAHGVASAGSSHYWLYGMSGSNDWISWSS